MVKLIERGHSRLRELRTAITKILPCIETMTVGERAALANTLWPDIVETYAYVGDYLAAYRNIYPAALGTKAFEGHDGPCRSHVEGGPIGLIATPICVMEMIHSLYYTMRRDCECMDLDLDMPRPQAKDGDDPVWKNVFELNRVADLMDEEGDPLFAVAAMQMRVMGTWVANHSRACAVAA